MTQGSMPYAVDDGYRLTVESVDGGTRQDLSMSLMPPNAWLKIVNMEVGDTGELQTRGGETPYNGTALDTLDNGIRFYKESTGSKTLIVSADTGAATKIYKGNDTTGAITEITGGSALSTAVPVEFLVFRDSLLIANGTQTLQYLTDPTGTTKGTCVFSDNNRVAKYMAAADNRLYVVIPTQPNRVYISEDGLWTTGPGTDCSFPTNNWIPVPGNFNDKIIGLKAYDNEVFVFQTKAVWIIYGEDEQTWGMRKVSEIGALNQRAISLAALGTGEMGGLSGLLFVNERSIWFWNPNAGDPVDVGKQIQDTKNAGSFQSSTYLFSVNTVVGFSTAEKRFYISYKKDSNSTFNDYAITVDDKLRTAETSQGACAYVDFSGKGDTGAFYRLSAATSGIRKGTIFLINSGTTDNIAPITQTLKTRHFNFGKSSSLKRMRVLYLGVNSASITDPIYIKAICDRGASSYSFEKNTSRRGDYWGDKKWGDFIWGGGNDYEYLPIWFPFGVQCRELQLEIEYTSSSAFKLYNYEIEYEEYPVRRM